jgi:hypothetical protein
MWSRKHERCINCGTTSKKHKGRGLCCRCWLKDWVRKNPERRKEHKQREYKKNFKRYQKNAKLYQQRNIERLKRYWSDWHRDKSFNGKHKEVLDRDKNKCLLCGSKKMIIIHHIDHNNKNNDINNLVTLCRRCHPRIHYSKNRVKIESELYRNMQKQAEMTCSS